MRLSLRTLVLSSAALCATTAFAATKQVKVDVPFNFVVKNHTYQAGAYRVEIEPERSLVILSKIQNPVHQQLMLLVGPAGNGDNPHKVRLTFDAIGTDRVLRTIQFDGLTTQNLDAHPKQKVGAPRIVGE
jgi:hypothetical protein